MRLPVRLSEDLAAASCFNRKLRDELLNGEIFYTLKEAQILIERWRREDNTVKASQGIGL